MDTVREKNGTYFSQVKKNKAVGISHIYFGRIDVMGMRIGLNSELIYKCVMVHLSSKGVFIKLNDTLTIGNLCKRSFSICCFCQNCRIKLADKNTLIVLLKTIYNLNLWILGTLYD